MHSVMHNMLLEKNAMKLLMSDVLKTSKNLAHSALDASLGCMPQINSVVKLAYFSGIE